MQQKGKLNMYPQMHKRSASIDIPLLLAVLVLIGIGCFFIYDFTVVGSTVPSKDYYLIRQLMYAMFGCFSLMVVSKIDYHFLSHLTIPLLIGVIMLLICAHTVGSIGFIHWQTPYLFIGTIGIHVAQLTEIVALLFLAQLMPHIYLSGEIRFLPIAFALFVCLLPMFAFNQKSTLVLLMILCCLLFLADLWALITALAFIGFLVCVRSFFLFVLSGFEPIVIQMTLQDPFSDISGPGFAVAQSIYAIADGGILGVGVGRGMMRYAVEDVCSAFILPAITEEIGLIGAAAILFVYLFLLMRMFIIATRAVDRWGFNLAGAIMVRYIAHFVLYLLVRVNLIPQLGDLSLPFISYGGTSIMTECILIGILLSIRRYQMESERR